MGLKMALAKENNSLYYDFDEAYWAISEVKYFIVDDTSEVEFALCAYPSRESKQKHQEVTPISTLPIGGNAAVYYSEMYRWQVSAESTTIFPNGIPNDRDSQYKAIYTWIKDYTGLPFEDVLEE